MRYLVEELAVYLARLASKNDRERAWDCMAGCSNRHDALRG